MLKEAARALGQRLVVLDGSTDEQLRLNANGIDTIEALFAQLRGFVSHL
jgi:hypothetical protein